MIQTMPPLEDMSPDKDSIQGEMTRLRQLVAELDGLRNLDSDIFRQDRDHTAVDQDWMDGTIRDIAIKGNEVIEEPVCTPTTITTGSGRQVSESSPTRDTSSLIEDMQTTKTQGFPGPASYKKPDVRPAENSAEISPTKARLNMQPREALGDETPVTDTTSVRHIMAIKDRSEKLVRKSPEGSPGGSPEIKVTARLCNTAPTTSTRWQIVNRSGGATAMSAGAVGMDGASLVPRGVLGRKLKLKKSKTLHRAPPSQPESMARTQASEARIVNLGDELDSLTVRTPGGYPSHLCADDDIADHSNEAMDGFHMETVLVEAQGLKHLWDSTKRLLHELQHRGASALHMYWRVVSPIFNSRSGSWQTNTKQKATWSDRTALALLLPGVILATAVLV